MKGNEDEEMIKKRLNWGFTCSIITASLALITASVGLGLLGHNYYVKSWQWKDPDFGHIAHIDLKGSFYTFGFKVGVDKPWYFNFAFFPFHVQVKDVFSQKIIYHALPPDLPIQINIPSLNLKPPTEWIDGAILSVIVTPVLGAFALIMLGVGICLSSTSISQSNYKTKK